MGSMISQIRRFVAGAPSSMAVSADSDPAARPAQRLLPGYRVDRACFSVRPHILLQQQNGSVLLANMGGDFHAGRLHGCYQHG